MSTHESSKAITCARYSAALDELDRGLELEVNTALGSPYARVYSTNDPITIQSGIDEVHQQFLLTPYRFETTGNMIGRHRGMDLAQYYLVQLSKYAKKRYAPKKSGFPKPRGNREYDTWKALHQRANHLLRWYFRFVMAWSAAIRDKDVRSDDDLEKTSPFEGKYAYSIGFRDAIECSGEYHRLRETLSEDRKAEPLNGPTVM